MFKTQGYNIGTPALHLYQNSQRSKRGVPLIRFQLDRSFCFQSDLSCTSTDIRLQR